MASPLRRTRGAAVDVFSAFPNAIVSGVWQLGQLVHDTDTGTNFTALGALDVIVDEADVAERGMNPNPDELVSDTLIYVKPDQLPTLNAEALVAGYLLKNGSEETYYAIKTAGIGKNQETGEIEHVELLIEPLEIANG